MGDNYEVQWLAETPYLVEMSDRTNWNSVAIKLTVEQYNKIEELESKQFIEMKNLLRDLANEN